MITVVVGLCRCDRGSPPERRRRVRASDVLALSLREQAVGPTGLARQPGCVGLGVIPIDAHHGVSVVLREARLVGLLFPHSPVQETHSPSSLCFVSLTKVANSPRTAKRPTANGLPIDTRTCASP